MKIKSLAVQGLCSAILVGLSVAPVWADVASEARKMAEPVMAAANEAVAQDATQPVANQIGETAQATDAAAQLDASQSTGTVATPAEAGGATTQVESRPSTLEERRAARQQMESKALAEPTDYTSTYVEENLANPTIGTPTEGQVYQELSADLNHDQHLERVTLIPFATSEYGDVYMQLTVFNDKDEIIYQSPKVTDCDNVKTFALYNAGECALQLLYDLDGDGNFELLESLPRSDVRPKPYRIWRWDGDKFVYLMDFTFQTSARDHELFVYDERQWDGVEDIAWLENIAVRGGELKADVMSWKSYGMAQGKAVLEPFGYRGLKVKRWEKHILNVQY